MENYPTVILYNRVVTKTNLINRQANSGGSCSFCFCKPNPH